MVEPVKFLPNAAAKGDAITLFGRARTPAKMFRVAGEREGGAVRCHWKGLRNISDPPEMET